MSSPCLVRLLPSWNSEAAAFTAASKSCKRYACKKQRVVLIYEYECVEQSGKQLMKLTGLQLNTRPSRTTPGKKAESLENAIEERIKAATGSTAEKLSQGLRRGLTGDRKGWLDRRRQQAARTAEEKDETPRKLMKRGKHKTSPISLRSQRSQYPERNNTR